jgi:RNA polymerase sigma factor (sigma-70 family)
MIARTDNAPSTLSPQVWRAVRRKARQLVGRAGVRPLDREDIEQELALHLWQALRNFNPEAGSPGAFVATVLARAGHSLLRRRNSRKRGKGHVHCSLTNEYEDPEGNIMGDQTDLVLCDADRPHEIAFDLAHDVDVVLAQLPPHLRQLAEDLKRQKVSEIARRTGVSRSTIYTRIAELRSAFSAAERKKSPRSSDTRRALCEVYK